jgi:hypothetical protein
MQDGRVRTQEDDIAEDSEPERIRLRKERKKVKVTRLNAKIAETIILTDDEVEVLDIQVGPSLEDATTPCCMHLFL